MILLRKFHDEWVSPHKFTFQTPGFCVLGRFSSLQEALCVIKLLPTRLAHGYRKNNTYDVYRQSGEQTTTIDSAGRVKDQRTSVNFGHV